MFGNQINSFECRSFFKSSSHDFSQVICSETQATEYAAVLTMVINDMGNYGCFPDCTENVSKPLLAEVIVNLIKRRPMNPGAAYGITLPYLFL